jgi:hypothetical protein
MSIVRRRGAQSATAQMLTRLRLPYFAQAYSSLGTLLARVRNSTGTAPVMYATPPGQITVPQNPNLSGRSNESSSSAESKGELYVNNLATRFLETTLLTIGPWVERLPWIIPNADAFLFSQYNPHPLRLSDLVQIHPCISGLVRHNESLQ